jgi:hypothetical protein
MILLFMEGVGSSETSVLFFLPIYSMRRFRIAAFTLTAVTGLTSNLSHARANEFSQLLVPAENMD